jgi:hypothetical protein
MPGVLFRPGVAVINRPPQAQGKVLNLYLFYEPPHRRVLFEFP